MKRVRARLVVPAISHVLYHSFGSISGVAFKLEASLWLVAQRTLF